MEDHDNAPPGESCWDAWMDAVLLQERREEEFVMINDSPRSTPRERELACLRWIRSIHLLIQTERHMFTCHLPAA